MIYFQLFTTFRYKNLKNSEIYACEILQTVFQVVDIACNKGVEQTVSVLQSARRLG